MYNSLTSTVISTKSREYFALSSDVVDRRHNFPVVVRGKGRGEGELCGEGVVVCRGCVAVWARASYL